MFIRSLFIHSVYALNETTEPAAFKPLWERVADIEALKTKRGRRFSLVLLPIWEWGWEIKLEIFVFTFAYLFVSYSISLPILK